ncbi:MAG: acetolactate synthase small subunit [Buchnera aphidicola (Periphyllus acericola)]|uniref:acetolactate synthase small subunit n=1 Tax=Buchnera aphidicola TaxID=9 RepID=UPI0030CCEE1F|nr:acetolactate synthase small subunit [Buchnera aphidicola (Periphyllus acericola)]
MIKTILLILVENKSDVLARIINLFSKTGYIIKNITISKTIKDKTLSYINIKTIGNKIFFSQIQKQLYKLIDVLKVQKINKKTHIQREILLIKFKLKNKCKKKIIKTIKFFQRNIISIYKKKYIIKISKKKKEIKEIIKKIEKIGTIIEISRSGIISISRIKKIKSN